MFKPAPSFSPTLLLGILFYTSVTCNVIRSNTCDGGVRFPGLGCYTLDPPFNNSYWLPQNPDTINTSFLLYTRANRQQPHYLRYDDRASTTSNRLNTQLPVKFIIHGFLQNAGMEFLGKMTKALLDKEPMNVIVVGWGDGAGFPYDQAVSNTRVVGAETARLLRVLINTRGLDARNVHLIGHSLGAQVASYVGSLLTEQIGRITGLDPAQPNFHGFDAAVRLDKDDARFVDVIHTDAVPYDTVRGYGMIEPVGDIDFYPNGGHDQPGCHEESSIFSVLEDTFRRGLTTTETDISCSHERSTELFTASIIHSSSHGSSHCDFKAFPCQSDESFMRGECTHCGNRPCPLMGYDAASSHGSRGVFYLNTTGSNPFCGFHHFVTLFYEQGVNTEGGQILARLTGSNGVSDWGVVKSGEIRNVPSTTGLLLVERHIGVVQKVEIRFVHQVGFFQTSPGVTVRKVMVDSVMRSPTKFFCNSASTHVPEGQVATFMNGSFEASHCQ